jgi:SNF2 family DNA or RNA helicase
VTGDKTQIRPEECIGGILADESGMGKTLSMLALVLETRKHAQRWKERHGETKSSGATVSHATLIVVPSDGMLDLPFGGLGLG